MRSLIFGLFLLAVGTIQAQSSKLTFGVSVNPTATFGINHTSSNEPIGGRSTQTYKQFADSIKSFESYKLSLGITGWMFYSINRKWSLQAGIGYSEVGFTRRQENIEIGDPLFPGIGNGVLLESSNTTKNVDYNFRYQYLTVPVLFNYYLKRSGDFKWTYYLTAGAAFNVLMKSQMKAELENFSVDGESVFKIDSTGYEGSAVTFNVFLGGRVEYKVDKQMSVFGQPMLTVFPVSVSNTPIKSNPIGLQLNCGLVFNLSTSENND